MNKRLYFIAVALLLTLTNYAQTSFSGFNYQAVIKDSSNQPLSNESVGLKIEIRKNGATGTLLYDETHAITTNMNGYTGFTVGGGVPVGGGTYGVFTSINWQDSVYFCNLFKWDTALLQYNQIGSSQIFAVPFSLYSKKTAQPFYLNKLSDVDTASISNGSVLKWNGIKWIIATDLLSTSDTVAFAFNSDYSTNSDTANYALNAQNIIPSDTAIYAVNSGNANYSVNSGHSLTTDTATYATTAGIANFANGTWRTTGNIGINPTVNFIGTTDANDVMLRTNDTTRMVIKSTGRIGIGTTTPATDLHIAGKNGILFQGTYGTGTIPYQGVGTRFMWYPKKAAFRGGTLDAAFSTFWDDTKIGNYSFSFGKNTQATGQYSLSFGEYSYAFGDYSAAIGFGCIANVGAPYSFCAGHNGQTFGMASVSLGRGNIARGLGSIAIGYHAEANANYSLAFGFYTFANGVNSVSAGYQCRAMHDGSFIYNDYSNIPAYLLTTAANQFMAKAAGGFIFYTNSAATSGVTLASGSGSWASLSDSTKKENFELVNDSEILKKISQINVYTWNYKSQSPDIRHIGPTAQEFSRLFGLGENNTTINTVDIDGVNMAAIKALAEKNALLEGKSKELEEALNQLKQLKKERELFKYQLDQLENTILNLKKENTVTVKK